MYTDFYRLSGRPFQLSPNHRFFYDSRTHRRAVSYLTYGLHQGEGFIVITGDIGAGKTTLIGYLQEKLGEQGFTIGRINATQLGADDVLRLVVAAFAAKPAGGSKADLLTALETRLHELAAARRRVLLVVDEAQNLRFDALEELRLLSNLEQDGKALLQILLVGQPQFRDTLASPALEQLRQRVVASYHLGPLDRSEVQAYVEHRLRKVGWQGDPAFGPEAFEEIHAFSQGLPRKINMLCARLLVFGGIEQRHTLSADDVGEVAAEIVEEQAPPEEATVATVPRRDLGTDRHEREEAAVTLETDTPAFWRDEIDRLRGKLEQVYDDLSRERHRADDIRDEAARLRDELHRLEIERLRIDAETARRLADLMRKLGDHRRGGLLRRLIGG